ncbi:translation initiation factor IF-2-like [Acinonyx jubatus]|uniref:Translation initiation factor IF-2-like n=1 Tax=Acinonyx jubatus TaxID=32536 RepID=A0ABM3NDW5_ACIJB|nr:translation initiation factor IF-2-like [Acinonyx jubatus]
MEIPYAYDGSTTVLSRASRNSAWHLLARAQKQSGGSELEPCGARTKEFCFVAALFRATPPTEPALCSLTPGAGPVPRDRPRPQDGGAHVSLRTAAGPTTLSHPEKLKAAESAASGDGGCAADGEGDGASASEAAGPGPLRPSAGPSPPPGLSCDSSGKRSPAPVPTSCPRRTPSVSLAATRAILAIGRGGPRSSSCACAALRPRAAGRRERKCSADPRAARGRAACCPPTWLAGSGSQVPGGGAGTGRRAGSGRISETTAHLLRAPAQPPLGFLVYRRASRGLRR